MHVYFNDDLYKGVTGCTNILFVSDGEIYF